MGDPSDIDESFTTLPSEVSGQELGTSKRVFFGSSLDNQGIVVERWADIFVDQAEYCEKFQNLFKANMVVRDIKNIEKSEIWLSTGGFLGIKRPLYLYSRPAAAVGVTIATQGNDLYISWRLFVRNVLDWKRVVIWLIVCGLLTLMNSQLRFLELLVNLNDQNSFSQTPIYSNEISFLVFSLVTGGILYFMGYFLNHFNEFFYDDAEGLAIIVQKSIIEVADQLEIDVSKLQPRESVMRQPRRRRI